MEQVDLTKTELMFIVDTCASALKSGVSALIIEKSRIRGPNEGLTVFILDEKPTIDLPFDVIAMANTTALIKRYQMIQDRPNIQATASVDKDQNGVTFARQLTIKAGRTTISFRCSNPMVVQSPKKANMPIQCTIDLTREDVALISKAKQAMKAEAIVFEYNAGSAPTWYVADVNGDRVTTELSALPQAVDTGDVQSFTYSYPLKLLIPLLLNSTKEQLLINSRGFMRIESSGLDLYIGPTQKV